MNTTRAKGFSLLELMIALGVLAIITMYALPAYRQHVAKANRVDASAALMRAAQFVGTARLAQTTGDLTLPQGFDQSPSSGTAIYTLAIQPESSTNGGYSIEATPVSTGAMQDDSCGTFSIDATGTRSNRTSTAPLDAAQSSACWGNRR
jgi:type IV pilus assembly protein PilE